MILKIETDLSSVNRTFLQNIDFCMSWAEKIAKLELFESYNTAIVQIDNHGTAVLICYFLSLLLLGLFSL